MLAPVPRPRAVQGFRESENAATGCEARTITNHEDTMPAVYKATKPDGSARLIVANNRNQVRAMLADEWGIETLTADQALQAAAKLPTEYANKPKEASE